MAEELQRRREYIEVDYRVDDLADDGDLPGAATLQRVSVSGLAVKLMRA